VRRGAVITVVGACAFLFGASFAAARLTADDGTPKVERPPAAVPVVAPEGRSLALDGTSQLPSLRANPKPKPKAPTTVASGSAPAGPPRLVARAPTPDPQHTNRSSAPSKSSEPAQPKPEPSPSATEAAPTHFFDSGGG
jgi:hypothetical protein